MLRATGVALLIGLVFAVSAQATTDPRKCSFSTSRAVCAKDAAKLVARRVLQRRSGQPYLWQGPMTCSTVAGSLLRWRCTFTTSLTMLPAHGYVAVTYRALSAGWTVRTAIVAT